VVLTIYSFYIIELISECLSINLLNQRLLVIFINIVIIKVINQENKWLLK